MLSFWPSAAQLPLLDHCPHSSYLPPSVCLFPSFFHTETYWFFFECDTHLAQFIFKIHSNVKLYPKLGLVVVEVRAEKRIARTHV